jgi:N-acetylneuraminic acid mutarotase
LGDKLIVAGGANFPDKKPWEGGKKRWYDEVWAFDLKLKTWEQLGKLPKPIAYGVSVTFNDAIICVGGSNDTEYLSDVFRLSLRDGDLLIETLPSLPIQHGNGAGGLVGKMLLIIGGQTSANDTVALRDLWRLDLESIEKGWKRLDDHPGVGRILPIVATTKSEFWVAANYSATMMESHKGVI